jgi:Big-like domain-containing protein
MNGTRVPRVRLVHAAALVLICSWAWISPRQASAQLLPPLLPPLPGSLVVTITSPTAGSPVAGTITVRASVSPVGVLVAGVQFELDGVNLGGQDTRAPYSVSWDTTTTGNGFHTLTAVARDALGVGFRSDPVRINVSNAPPPTVTRVEETDPAITYTPDWFQADPRPWSGGTAVVSATAGGQATFAFTGTSVDWIGFLGPQTGIARVFLDGVLVAEVDTYSPTEQVLAVVFRATSLAATSHRLVIEVTGQQNLASTGAYIVVDAFDITP